MNLILVIITYILVFVLINKYIFDYISKFVLIIFSSYWCISIGASTFSPYGLFEIHTSTYLLLMAALLAFAGGMCSVRQRNVALEIDKTYLHKLLCNVISSKWMLLLFILSILYLYKYAMIAIAVATLQGHADTSDQLNLIFQGNSMAQMIYGYLLMPLFHVSLVLISYYILNIKRVGLKYLRQFIVYIINLLIFIAIGGGRSTVVIVALYLLITYVCLSSRETLFKFSIKKLIYVAVAVVLVVYAVNIVSNYRNAGSFIAEDNSDNKWYGLELLLRYSLLPYSLLDYGLQHDYLGRFGYQFGKATLMGFDNWIYIPLKVMGIPYETSSNIVQYLDYTWITYDRSGTRANYAYTGLMYHYLDFGIIGVVFFPFLFGLIFRKLIISYYKTPVFSTLLLISMCFFLTMHAVFTCYLIKGWTGLYIMVLFVIRIIEQRRYYTRKKVGKV